MKNRLIKFLSFFFSLVIIARAVFIFQSPLGKIYTLLQKQVYPCNQPIIYSLGSFDARFGLSKEDFLTAIKQAEQLWEKPINKNLFQYELSGKLKINLIYDSRQSATIKLNKLGITIDDTEEAYNNLKKKYESLLISYNEKKISLENEINTFEAQKKTFEDLVASWNSKGGAPEKEYNALEAERQRLNAVATNIKQEQDNLNASIDDINAAANFSHNFLLYV